MPYLGHNQLKVPLRHPKGGVKKAGGYMGLEFKAEMGLFT